MRVRYQVQFCKLSDLLQKDRELWTREIIVESDEPLRPGDVMTKVDIAMVQFSGEIGSELFINSLTQIGGDYIPH